MYVLLNLLFLRTLNLFILSSMMFSWAEYANDAAGNINSLLHPRTFTILIFISHEYFLKNLFPIKTSTSFVLFSVSGFRYAVVGMA